MRAIVSISRDGEPWRLGKHRLRLIDPVRCALIAFAAWAVFAVTMPGIGVAAEEQAQQCTWHSGQGVSGPPVKPSVKLVPDTPGEIVNFAGSRGREFVDVVLNATPALPTSLHDNQIRLEVLRRFTRASQTLQRATAPEPTFTPPKISPNRDRVTFTVCLNGSGLNAGSYTGSIYIEGPPGLSPTSVSITENATNSDLAFWGGIVVLIAALVFLWLRGAAARQVAVEKDQAEKLTQALASGDQDRITAARAARPKSVVGYLLEVWTDLNWIITSIVALGAAAGTIIGIYKANPAWGADTLGSLVALVGPAFTAVGVQSVVASLGRSVTKGP